MQIVKCFTLGLILVMLAATGGGTRTWTLPLATILSFAAAILPLHKIPSQRFKATYIPPIALILLTALMLMPLPDKLTPGSRRTADTTARTAIQTLADATATEPITATFALTRSRAGTARFAWIIAAGFAVALLMRSLTPQYQSRALAMLCLIGAAMAIAGIIGKWIIPQGDTLYWIFPVPHGKPGPMGGFMNRNHFAGTMAILAPIALTLAMQAINRKQTIKAITALLLLLLFNAAVLLSLSRGGVLALSVAMPVTLLYAMPSLSLRSRFTALIVFAILAALVIGAALQHPAIQQRMTTLSDPASIESLQTRQTAWRDSLEILKHYPILGAGPNAFRTVYPQHRLSSERAARDFAENEYVQWMAETGLVGVIIAFGFVLIILKQFGQALLNPSQANAFAAAGAGALTAASIHAIVDFPLRLPLYALTLTALVTLLWPTQPQPNRAQRILISFALLLVIATAPIKLNLDSQSVITTADPITSQKALAYAPTFPLIWRRMSAITAELDPKTSLDFLNQATQYDPHNYPLWINLGKRYHALGLNHAARQAYHQAKALRDWIKIPPELEAP